MQKVLYILRHEVYTMVRRFSFWFGLLGVPVIGLLIYAGINLINSSQSGSPSSPAAGIGQIFAEPEDTRPYGYVDEAGLIVEFPEGFDISKYIGYANYELGRSALDRGELSVLVRIPPDYIETGQLYVFTPQFNLINTEQRAGQLRELIDYNLLGEENALTVFSPLHELEEVNISPDVAQVRDPDSGLTFALPYAAMMLFYMAILGSAGLLLNSVTKEKENRILEILLLSSTPHQLLLGKIIGLGLVGLAQVVVWAGSAYTLLLVSGRDLPPEFRLDPSILLWGVIFFLFGYLVYASLMAGIGALVPNLREASQASFVVIIPLLIPMFLIGALIDAPNSPLAIALSLFPFTAPTTMMLRLAAGSVPLWQLLLACALLVVTVLLVIRAVAGLFHAQTLMSGQAFNLKRFFLALAGKS